MIDTHSTTHDDVPDRVFATAAEEAFHSIMITEGGSHADGHKIVFVNKAFTQMTGYTPDEVIGKTPRFLQGDKTDKAVVDQLAKDLETNRDFHGRTINYRKDGSEFMIEWKVFPITDSEGSVTHHVAVQRDITAQ